MLIPRLECRLDDLKGFLDLLTVYFLTGFRQRPQHLLGTVGIVSFLIGLASLTYLLGCWVLAQLFPEWGLLPLHQRPLVIYSMGALLLGAQFMSIGFLAELMTAYYGHNSLAYSVKERLGSAGKSEPAISKAADRPADVFVQNNPAQDADAAKIAAQQESPHQELPDRPSPTASS